MPSLRELQRGFSASVLHALSPEFTRHVVSGRFRAEQHFQVYRNNVFENLTAALKAVYPAVERLVGEGFFRYATARYIPAHPPGSGNVHDFGGDFANFLENFPPARQLVYLADVARLEWTWHQSFHAADRTPLLLTELATLTPDRYDTLRFKLHPAARLLASAYPILRIWQVNQPAYGDDMTVNLDQGGDKLLVMRRQQVEIEQLGDGEYALLSAIATGGVLAHAAEQALRAQADFDLATALARHIGAGTLSEFTADPLYSYQPKNAASGGKQ